ncbi:MULTISPECIES: biphenyl 2,3-dioxygenase [unclassified Rhodococcus (in: high G+C Gram-positive bacteria)]|uniref:biphenyl 2,3-dioxygenase n=1 Tax=unclassified Rhodococcus (in: high G+C Gram-positive bacteria) TaxID=192944 RepID=UPI003397C60F
MRTLVALSILLLAIGCSTTPDVDATVHISNVRFDPQEVHIPVGGTVEWQFDDGGLLHEVHADDVFDSGVSGDSTYRFTFDTPGEVEYHCSIHPYMSGIVHVG